MLKRLQRAQRQLRAWVCASDDERLYANPWYGKWTQGRMIQLNSAAPYDNARKRLHHWLKHRDATTR